jgi:hypothetical protein
VLVPNVGMFSIMHLKVERVLHKIPLLFCASSHLHSAAIDRNRPGVKVG